MLVFILKGLFLASLYIINYTLKYSLVWVQMFRYDIKQLQWLVENGLEILPQA